MTIVLPTVKPQYVAQDQSVRDEALKRLDSEALKRNQDIELQPGQKLVLRSPNGARWRLDVSNAGALTATAL